MLKRVPLYPFLVALFPVLALAAHNINQIAPGDMFRPLLLSLLFAGVILGLAYLLLRDWDRAALVASLALLFFFSYGQVYTALKGISLGGVLLFRHRILGLIWMLLLVVGLYWIGWKANIPRSITGWLNVLLALMLVYPSFTIASSMLQNAVAARAAAQVKVQAGSSVSQRPDIYYIILDAYARQDTMEQEFAYDNSEFVQALKTRGFEVAECGQSNYAQTEFSLASSLNYDYLDNLQARSPARLRALIKHGAVRGFLESQGYETVSFPTGFNWSEWNDADLYPRPEYRTGILTEFEDLLLGTSLLRIPLDRSKQISASGIDYVRYRQRVLSTLNHLKEIPSEPAPTLTFAHLVIPHFPYVFGPNGEEVDNTSEGYKSVIGYRDQVIFINREILKVIDAILAGSETPPLIIIQGDHGPPTGDHELRMRILNAYYLPGVKPEAVVYPSISPVNTFRLIFNGYFGLQLPLLDDKSFYSSYAQKKDFEFIPNSCPGQ